MKRLTCLLLILALLAGLLPAALAESDFDARQYTLYVIDSETTFINPVPLYFFDGVNDLPWLDLQDLREILIIIQRDIFENPGYELTCDQNGAVFTLKRENDYSMEVNFDADTITFDDYNGFLNVSSDNALLDVLSFSGYSASGEAELFQRDALASFDRYGDEMVLNLADYDIYLNHADGQGFIPLQTANDFLFAPMYNRYILFNGEAMFLANDEDFYDFNADAFLPLGELYYAAEPVARSQALADFGFSELCMMMDAMYGLKEQHDIEYFGQMFWQVAFDEALASTDPEEADTALKNFINYYLDDLHSGFALPSWMTGPYNIDSELGPSSRLSFKQDEAYLTLRAEVMGKNVPPYQEVGNTAYVTFDNFTNLGADDYYKTGVLAEKGGDTIGLIIHARKQIYREGSPIENVVIDLSNNVGGNVDAALFVISWILGEAEVSMEDTFTGAQSTMVYRADVNLDRSFDDLDTLADKRVYCLISPVSFSCGNLVPSECKARQAVTLIGRTTGGGSCIVQNMSTAWGTMFQISGPTRMSFRKNGSLYDIDEGVEPDVYIDHLETLYDREALTALINGLS